MFQSVELVYALFGNSIITKIIDSDFEEVGVEVAAVIEAYEKRNLNVAANLMLAMLYISKKWKYSVQQIINWNKQYNPKYAKYEKDIEKYMVLL